MNAAEAERQEGEEGSVEGGEKRMSRRERGERGERGEGHIKHIRNAVREAPCYYPYLKIMMLKRSCDEKLNLSACLFALLTRQLTHQVQKK